MADEKKIAVPYDPNTVIGEWGWLWLRTSQGDEWVICRTVEDDEDLIVETWDREATADAHGWNHAHELTGSPYLPLSSPACGPDAGLLVTIRLPVGASMAYSHELGTDAERLRRAVLVALELMHPAPDEVSTADG